MRRIIKWIAIVLGAALIGGIAQTKTTSKSVHLNALPADVSLGVYDNFHKMDNVPTISIELLWCWQNKYKQGTVLPQLKEVAAKGRTPILTIEPYPIKWIGTADTLLEDIAGGKYDAITKAIAKEITDFGSPVYIRWAPEMEMNTVKPWSTRPPAQYVAAYRHVAEIFRAASPLSPLVWSPVGNEGADPYYPGDDVVDYVAYSLYELPAASISWAGHPRTFADWMDDKYHRFAHFGKPIIITELGVCDTPAKQKIWMQGAFATVKNYPQVKALIYFNTQDEVSWKKWGGKGAPNWMINPAVFTNP